MIVYDWDTAPASPPLSNAAEGLQNWLVNYSVLETMKSTRDDMTFVKEKERKTLERLNTTKILERASAQGLMSAVEIQKAFDEGLETFQTNTAGRISRHCFSV